jgi:hypothetical protein
VQAIDFRWRTEMHHVKPSEISQTICLHVKVHMVFVPVLSICAIGNDDEAASRVPGRNLKILHHLNPAYSP